MSRHPTASATIPAAADRHEPTRLMFFGDPHGEFEPIVETVQRVRPEAIVLLGDLQAQRPLHVELAAIRARTEIWFIHGNHDTDAESYFDHLWGGELADHNVHGRVVKIAGLLVAGLGGIFRESVWDPASPVSKARFASAQALRRDTPAIERWRGGISLRHRSTIFPDDVARLANKRADILVTHEGLGGTPHGQPRLDELARAMRVKLVVHGHLHQDIDYQREGRLGADSPFLAYGIDQGSHLGWPHRPESDAPALLRDRL